MGDLLLAMMAVLCVCAFGFFAIRSARVARSSFYSIGACTAAGILLVQTILNTLGTVDILPFTGGHLPLCLQRRHQYGGLLGDCWPLSKRRICSTV